jgi:hypothetical protein
MDLLLLVVDLGVDTVLQVDRVGLEEQEVVDLIRELNQLNLNHYQHLHIFNMEILVEVGTLEVVFMMGVGELEVQE